MHTLDFCAPSKKMAKQIISCFSQSPMYPIDLILNSFWKSRDDLIDATRSVYDGQVLQDGTVKLPLSDSITIHIWVQGRHFLISLDLSARKNPTWECLHGMVLVIKKTNRHDLPVRVNKDCTITMKAAVAIAALDFAQGVSNLSGILIDMARDKEI